jgi:hypothetical protein
MTITYQKEIYTWDSEKSLTKWLPVLTTLNLPPILRQRVACYAEFYQQTLQNDLLDNKWCLLQCPPSEPQFNESINLLPLNLKALSHIDWTDKTLEIVGDEVDLPYQTISLEIHCTDWEDIQTGLGLDVRAKLEDLILQNLVTKINFALQTGTTLQIRHLITTCQIRHDIDTNPYLHLGGYFQVI